MNRGDYNMVVKLRKGAHNILSRAETPTIRKPRVKNKPVKKSEDVILRKKIKPPPKKKHPVLKKGFALNARHSPL